MKTIAITLIFFLSTMQAHAGLASEAVSELAEFCLKKAGIASSKEAVSVMSQRIINLSTKYGDDAVSLIRKSGHLGVEALEQAGTQGKNLLKITQKYGDEGINLVTNATKRQLFLKHGDDAVEAMIKHPGIAEDLMTHYGKQGANALKTLSKENGQRLAMLHNNQVDKQLLSNPGTFATIEKYGDKAMKFIWNNKGALAVGTVLTAFINDPEAFLNGTKKLTEGIVSSVNWTLIGVILLAIIFLPTLIQRLLTIRTKA